MNIWSQKGFWMGVDFSGRMVYFLMMKLIFFHISVFCKLVALSVCGKIDFQFELGLTFS